MREKLTHQYNSLYAAHDEVYGEVLPPVKFLAEQMSGGSVLDIGGGQGRNALYLAERGFAVRVIDISKVGIEQLRKAAVEAGLQIATQVADVVETGIGQNYDALVCTFVLHHLDTDDARALVHDMQAHTNPGGINVIATFTNSGGLFERNQKSGSGRYYPAPEEVLRMYAGWEILLQSVKETTSHARDKEGRQLPNTRIVLIARKS